MAGRSPPGAVAASQRLAQPQPRRPQATNGRPQPAKKPSHLSCSHGLAGHGRMSGHSPAAARPREYTPNTSKTGQNQRYSYGRTSFSQAPGGRTSSPYYTRGASPHPEVLGNFVPQGAPFWGW